MPTWSPNWTDVRFDRAAAERAASECERAARIVRHTADRREALATSALADGRGPWRDQLKRQGAELHGRAADLEVRLRALATSLRVASARAQTEQSNRLAARQQWKAEAKAETDRATWQAAARQAQPPSSPMHS